MNTKYRAAQTVILSVVFLLFASVSLANAQEDDTILRPALSQGLRLNTPVTVTNFLSITYPAAAINGWPGNNGAAGSLAGTVTPAVPAATITVQSAADDGSGQANRCPGQNCGLRDAIAKAANGDTITFAGDYTINLEKSELGSART